MDSESLIAESMKAGELVSWFQASRNQGSGKLETCDEKREFKVIVLLELHCCCLEWQGLADRWLLVFCEHGCRERNAWKLVTW